MIHPTAVVEQGAELGEDVELGPFAYIQAGARVGDRCRIGPHASILRHTTLGEACEVHAGAVLGDLPQDLHFEGGVSHVEIAARCVIREGVTVHRGTKAGSVTRVGEGCFLMAFSHLAHNVELAPRVIVANGALLAGHVKVGQGAFISGNCVVHQFVRIGRLAMLGGACGVSQDVPPFCLVKPLLANTLGGLNVVGLRRGGVDAGERLALKQAYRALFLSGTGLRAALERLGRENSSATVRELCEFIGQAGRGVCRPPPRGSGGGDGGEA